MIWVIVFTIVAFVVYRVFMNYVDNNPEKVVRVTDNLVNSRSDSLDKKYSVLASVLNTNYLKGRGTIHVLNKNSFEIYQPGSKEFAEFLVRQDGDVLYIRFKSNHFGNLNQHEDRYEINIKMTEEIQRRLAQSFIDDLYYL